MGVIGTDIYHFCYLLVMQVCKNQLENHRFTFCTEEILYFLLNHVACPYVVDVDDYKTAMTIALSEA